MPYSVTGCIEQTRTFSGRVTTNRMVAFASEQGLCGYPPFFTAFGLPPRVPSLPSLP